MSIDMSIRVPVSAYPYLEMQRGAISHLRADDEMLWLRRYVDSIVGEFTCIEPYLPKTCDAILDVGSGLGGIDILLTRHYGETCEIALLDGTNDDPMVESHAKTFNHMGVAREFLSVNGVRRVHCLDANDSNVMAPCLFDLIVSFKSWCFHVEPVRYIDFVLRSSINGGGTKIIVDMRQENKEPERAYRWMRQMTGAFRHVCMIYYGTKFETHLFETR